jgi:hypothetical protein
VRGTADRVHDGLREQPIGCDELRRLRQRMPDDESVLLRGHLFRDVRAHAMQRRRVREHDGQ